MLRINDELYKLLGTPCRKPLYGYKGVINFFSKRFSIICQNDDLLFRQPVYFQGALKSFIVENEIKMIRALKNRSSEETQKQVGVIHPEAEKADEGHSKTCQLCGEHSC